MRIDSTASRRMDLVFLLLYLVASGIFAWTSVVLWISGMDAAASVLNLIPHAVLWTPAALSLTGCAVRVRGRRPTALLWMNALLWIVLGGAGAVGLPEDPRVGLMGSIVFGISLISLGCIGYLIATR